MQDQQQGDESEASVAGGNRVRVTHHSISSSSVAFDGAWWPTSRQLVAELPPLLATLGNCMSRVVAVGFRREDWAETPPQTTVDCDAVDLLGFDSAEVASVILIGHDGHHLTLRVIAPESDARDARLVLDSVPDEPAGDAGALRSGAAVRILADVAQRLATHEGLHDDERTAQIQRWCDEAATQFETARVQSFVPILVEHIVYNQMKRSRARIAS
jgi:Family of unknown function (DUF5994)